MALTEIEVGICNKSLGRIGASQIVYDTNMTLPPYTQCELHYGHTRDSLLRSYLWNFARKRIALASIWVTTTYYAVGQYVWTNSLLYKCVTSHTSGTFATDLAAVKWTLITARPAFDYSYEYDLPSDYLRYKKCSLDGMNYLSGAAYCNTYYYDIGNSYSIENKKFLTDETAVNLEYIYQVTDTTVWDSLFYDCFVLKLAINLLYPLAGTQTGQMRQMLEQELNGLLSKAVTVSYQENGRNGSSVWNNARYGSGII